MVLCVCVCVAALHQREGSDGCWSSSLPCTTFLIPRASVSLCFPPPPPLPLVTINPVRIRGLLASRSFPFFPLPHVQFVIFPSSSLSTSEPRFLFLPHSFFTFPSSPIRFVLPVSSFSTSSSSFPKSLSELVPVVPLHSFLTFLHLTFDLFSFPLSFLPLFPSQDQSLYL